VTAGTPVTLSVVVASADGKTAPVGMVSIAGSPVALSPVAAVNGRASFQLNVTTSATYSLVANFTGDGKTSGSSASSAVSLTVNAVTIAAPTEPVPNSGSVDLSLSTQSVKLQPGQTSPVTVQLTPQGDFNQTVSLSCQGLPAAVGCSFEPAALKVAKSPASTTMQVSSGSSSAKTGEVSGVSGIAYGAMLPWNLIGMLATTAARKRKRLGAFRTLLVLVLTGAGALAMTGCGVAYNTTPQSYAVTLTATANGVVVKTTTFNVVLQEKTAPW
jgi:Bacterial Ig-like domain (group 3)